MSFSLQSFFNSGSISASVKWIFAGPINKVTDTLAGHFLSSRLNIKAVWSLRCPQTFGPERIRSLKPKLVFFRAVWMIEQREGREEDEDRTKR